MAEDILSRGSATEEADKLQSNKISDKNFDNISFKIPGKSISWIMYPSSATQVRNWSRCEWMNVHEVGVNACAFLRAAN